MLAVGSIKFGPFSFSRIVIEALMSVECSFSECALTVRAKESLLLWIRSRIRCHSQEWTLQSRSHVPSECRTFGGIGK